MGRLLLLTLALLPSLASARELAVPVVREKRRAEDPDFKKAPDRKDYHSLVRHLGDCITDTEIPQNRVPGVDFFIGQLEQSLKQGNDLPLNAIAQNADQAREALRLAFNDLAAAGVPLATIREELKEVAVELEAVIENNDQAVHRLESVAEAARASVQAIVLQPPASPVGPVPMETLDAIDPQRPAILALRKRLEALGRKVGKAKTAVKRAKKYSAVAGGLGQNAGKLDADSLEHLGQRRTSGRSVRYESTMQSKEVILNANTHASEAVKGADEVLALVEEQLDGKHDGVRRALDRALETDGEIQEAKELSKQSAERINFNRDVRLNHYINHGWLSASGSRQNWWVGRAQMARSEGRVDSKKMDDAYRRAHASLDEAERVMAQGKMAVEKVEKALGEFTERPEDIAQRPLDVPEVREVKVVRSKPKKHVKSQALKVPKTFNVSDDEIMGSYDNR